MSQELRAKALSEHEKQKKSYVHKKHQRFYRINSKWALFHMCRLQWMFI